MQEASKTASKNYIDWIIWGFIVILLVYRFYIIYFPFKLYQYLVPPGQDPVNHLEMVKSVISGNFKSTYPLLFHGIIALINRFSGSDPLQIIKWVTPAMVALPSIAVFLFLRKNFGRFAAVVGFAIALLSSNYALMAFGDGNYPNILAGGFFLPLALLYVTYASRGKKISNYIYVGIFALLIVATHHFTAALFGLIMIIYLIVLLLWNRREKIAPGMRGLMFFILGMLVVMAALIIFTPLRSQFLVAIQQLFTRGAFVDDPAYSAPIQFSQYSEMIGNLVWSGGLISMLYLIYLLGKPGERNRKSVILLVLVWFAITFGLSRTGAIGLPGRFAREIGLPLILAMAITVKSLFENFTIKMQRIIGYGMLGLIIAVNLVQVNGGAYASPEYFNKMVWFTNDDLQKAQYIMWSSESGDKIVSNRTSPYMSYFTQREFIYPTDEQIKSLAGFTAQAGAKYLFIGKLTAANPNQQTYPFFKNFDESTAKLNEMVQISPQFEPIHTFADGSVLYQFNLYPRKKK